MKGRTLLTTVLVVVLATSFMVPVAVAQDSVREESGAPPAEGGSLEELQEQLDAGLITEKEFDQLAPTGPGCCAPEDAGGPDDYGYVYIDSDEPGGPTFSWVDISATGTAIPFAYDTVHGPYPIGFAFDFYGTDYIEMWVSSEGWVSTLTATSSDWSNDCPLPSTNGQEGLIAPFWDDRGPSAGPYGSGFYESFAIGSCPYGGYPGACLVVEWLDMPLYGNASDLQTFEVILFDDNTFLMQILDAGTAAGTSATTGIENQDATVGLTYGCNTAGYLANTLAIFWYKAPPAPKFDGSFKLAPPQAQPGDTIDYSVAILNTGDAPAFSAVMTDVIPAGTTYVPDSVTCDSGTCWYEAADDAVYWSGELGGIPAAGARSPTPGELLTSPGGSREPQGALTDLQDVRHTVVPGTAGTGVIIENFPNTWDSSIIGLVYNLNVDTVRYAHESQPNPTIYDVDYPAPHNLLGSISLSGLNPGWIPGLDNRDGAAYDFTLDTYFLPDFNGDQANADDNIVEIDANGIILNAWETDNGLGSNDSYDGSAINQIIDMAVAPGAPPRYFVAAAGDGSVVYEIELLKTGVWWTPGTWGTLNVWPVPGIGDNVGIDYDAEHGVLYHSDFNSTNIVITDLDGNVLDQFACNSPAGFNTGVTYVEGKAIPEVWVTDYASNSTTRCEIVPPPPCGLVTVFYDDFEGGLTNWAVTGLWNDEHDTDVCGALVAPFPSPDHDAYYGIDGVCTYNDGAANAGELEMVLDVDLSQAQGASLHFWSYEETECGFGNCGVDSRWVDVSTDGGATWATVWGSMGPEGQWYPAEADLSAYVGGPLRVRFRFVTLDNILNDFFGWMVDNVEIVACMAGGANVNFQVVADGVACGDVVVNEAAIDDPEALAPAVVMADTAIWDGAYYAWNFEDGYGGFVANTPPGEWEWGTLVPSTSSPPAAHSGLRLWATNLSGDISIEPSDHYLTRTVDLPLDLNGVYLEWWDWWHEDGSDYGRILVNGTEVYYIDANQLSWENHVVDLSPWAGQTVDIVFYYQATGSGDAGAGWYVDDVSIYGSCAVTDLTLTKEAPGKVESGSPMDYVIVVENLGTIPSADTYLTDTLPVGMTYVPGEAYANYGTLTDDAGHIYWNGTVAMFDPLTITIPVVADAPCGEVAVNSVVLTDPNIDGPLFAETATEIWDSVYLHQDFEGAFPPAGWQVIDNAGTGAVWDRNDAFGQPNQCAYGSGFSAAAHASGSGVDWDTELWSPPFTLPAGSGAFLRYASNFQDYVGNGDIYLDVSTDGGMSWTNLRYQTADDPAGGTLEVEDLSGFAGETLTLRWVYTATASTAWYWHIDDVQVIDCIPPDMAVDVPPLEAVLCPGEMESIDFSICNVSDGSLPLLWGLSEITGTYTLAPFGLDGIGDAWETMAPLPSARVFNAVIASGPYVYVIGGTSDAGGSTPTDTNFRYNTADDTWSTMTPMPAALDSIDGIAIDGSIYIPGSEPDSNTYVYDTAADTWSVIPANGGYAAPVQYQVVAIGTDLYVLGGIIGGASTTDVWVLDTTSGTWSAGVPMQNSRTSFSAAAIGDNIYVAGGVLYPGFVPDMTAEMFDGAAWSYIAPVPDGGGAYTRWSYNADGMAPGALWLGAGRRDAGWAVLNHAGYYDVATDTWTDSPTIPELDQGRVYMEGDVAADNYFYVIGGRDAAGATIYDTNERLMVYTPPFDVPWLTEVPTSGLLFSAECVTVEVTFDPMDMAGGTYTATLGLESNDPDMPFTSLPVTLTVLVPPTIELTPLTLEAPTCPGGVELLDLEICNLGECALDWFAVEVSETVELVGSAPFVPAGSATQGPIPQAPLTDSAPASAPVAVPSAPASPEAVLWDQPLSAVNQGTYANQDFEEIFDAFDIFIADDFSNDEWWAIDNLFVVANTWNAGCDLDCATTLNWHVYADAGGVPAGDPWGGGDPPLWAMSLPTDDPMVSFGTGTGGFLTNVTLTLDIPLYLPPATYWLVFYPSLNYVDCVCQSGRQVADTTNGNVAQVINPGGGFGFPTVWTSVQDPSTWQMAQQDLAFRLEGEVLPDVPWLSLDPAAGTVEPGMCVMPEATLDSTGLLPGDYTANLLLVSNDPFAPISTVPVTFTVWAPAEVVDVSYVATFLTVDFDATVAGEEPLTFAWDFGDGNTSDLEDPTHTYAAEGCYDVVFTATNTCDFDVWSAEVCVVAECEAVDGLAFTWMPETPLVDESVLFVATEPLTGTPPFTYTWDFGDGFGDVGQAVNHAYGAADDYEVTLMVENACGEASIMETVTVEAGMHYIYLPIVVKNN